MQRHLNIALNATLRELAVIAKSAFFAGLINDRSSHKNYDLYILRA
jgi:hypothetical protein